MADPIEPVAAYGKQLDDEMSDLVSPLNSPTANQANSSTL